MLKAFNFILQHTNFTHEAFTERTLNPRTYHFREPHQKAVPPD